MFGAIGRLFATIGYLFTGRIDRIRGIWSKNPDVISAKYDRVHAEKRTRLNQYKDAVGGMIAQEETKKITLKAVTEEIVKLERLKAGALAKAKQVAEKYNGNAEAAKADADYQRCQGAYRDFSTTLEEKQKRVTDLEKDVTDLSHRIAGHKTSIESLLRDLEKVKNEKHETIAIVVSAEEEKRIADTFSGISEDKTAQELQELRDTATRAAADARMSRELAGLDSKKAEDEFLEFATNSVADDEFDKLIGLTKESSDSSASKVGTKITE